MVWYRAPARRVVAGNDGWLGESGWCWVSRQKPVRRWYTAPAFPRGTTLLTGTPVRAALRALAASRGLRAPGAIRVLVLGGSQGSPFLNARVPDLMGRVACRGDALQRARHDRL